MTTLRVIIDELLAPLPGGDRHYAEELTRAVIAAAPRGTQVTGVVSASTEAEYEDIDARLPALGGLFKSALARRELRLAWHRGFTRLPGGGMVHSPSLLAPLSRHDRLNNAGDQTIVTIHSVVPWAEPDTLGSRAAGWYTGMAKRAQRYADAIVVPTHAVAERLAEFVDFGDRVRVIEGAASANLTAPSDAADRRGRLGLTDRYVVTLGTASASQLQDALAAVTAVSDLTLVVLEADHPDLLATLAAEAGLAPERAIALPTLGTLDRGAVLAGAATLIVTGTEIGFGLLVLDALTLGTPLVHRAEPTLSELAAGAGLEVGGDDDLADALRSVLDDGDAAVQLGIQGQDRARAFSWRSAGEKVWQLHADL